MFKGEGVGSRAARAALGLSCYLAAVPGWAAAPPAPSALIPEIQSEFTRLYELPDSVLALQVEPTLEIFPEYRAQLITYLAQGASPERQKILANVSKPSKEEAAAWFETRVGKAAITAVVVGGAIAAIVNQHGGGHGSSSQPAAAPLNQVPDPGLDASAREVFRTREYKNTMTLNAIHADYAYARGGTGEGVVISVQDVDQVNTSNPELVNQLAPGSVLGGTNGHGTAVARTALGEKNDVDFHGVAYDAKLLTHWGQNDAQVVDREIQYGAKISNHSYTVGGTQQQIANSYGAMYQHGVADGDIIYVWAAGNDNTQTEPSTFASLPLVVPGLEGHWLAVVAVNLNIDWSGNGNATASGLQGNPCGSAKAWCISAPGFGFQNPIEDFSHGISFTTGSSLAAPTVSGALAILMDVFPTLTSEQIVQRVLVSANKTGIYADQDIYGQGLLDLASATRPIGALMINTRTGMAIPLSQAAVAESSVMGNAIRSSLSRVNLVLKDSLDAPFVVNGSALSQTQTAQRSRIKTEDYLTRLNQQYEMQHMQRGGLTLNFSEGGEGSGLAAMGQVQAWQQVNNDMALSASVNTDPSWNQGLLQSTPTLRNVSATQAFSNPYLSLDEHASGAGLHWNLDQNWYSSVQAQIAKAPQEFADRPSHAQQRSVQSEWGYHAENGFSASLQLGALEEQKRMLGSRSESLLGDGDARTFFSGLNLAVPLNRQWRLYGRYNTGQTSQNGNGWAGASSLRSDSFTLGVNGQPTPQLQVGALAYQPLRLTGGTLSTTLPTGLNADNSVAWNKVNLDLNAEGRHMEYELFFRYDLPLWDVNFKGSLLRVEDYNNQAGNDDSMVILSAGMKY